MNGKQCRYKCAAPDATSHVAEQEEKQKSRDRVEQDIREMMTAGSQSKELAIEHVRNRGERMPVARVSVSERPRDAAQRQAACDDRIAVNVRFIIKIDEIVLERLPKHEPRNGDKKDANPNDLNALARRPGA